MDRRKACREIIEALMQTPKPSRKDIDGAKLRVARSHGLTSIVSNAELIHCLKPYERRSLLPILRRKSARTISGVTVIAAMTKPCPCPHKNPCAYCPGGPTQGVPQSYTGREPAAMRGMQNQYDAYLQVSNRIKQLEAIGHCVDKVELIVMGGTFPSTPIDYQESFMKGCLDAIVGFKTRDFEETKKIAERSRIHNVGITVETRPDWARRIHVDRMLTMGVTRMELGVQNIYDDIYLRVNRGHTVEDVVEATRILKDAGLKVCYHLMPGLPDSNFKRDLEGFKTVFKDPKFSPDMIKIYPCLVLKKTEIYRMWRRGEYAPYTTEDATEIITEIKKFVPPWIRIMRVQRDIPSHLVEAGVKKSNLRQLVFNELREQGARCHCIRCREVGHRWLRDRVKPDLKNVKFHTIQREASEGVDVFLSLEDQARQVLIAYLRLRIPSHKAHRQEIASEPSTIIRELHVCGSLVPVGKHVKTAWQHKGYGSLLLSEAERISIEEYNRRKVVVISALGTKEYYRRFNYSYDGPYMSKEVE